MSRIFKFAVVFVFVLFLAAAAHAQEAGRAYFDLGVFAFDDGDYEQAEQNLKAALSMLPDSPLYNHYLGKTYLKVERYDEAVAHLKLAYDIDPALPGVAYDLALGLFQVQDYTRAAELFIQVYREDAANVLAQYHAGISLYKQGQYAAALSYLIDAAEKSPSIKPMGYFYAGVCHQQLGNTTAAANKFQYVRDNAEDASLKASAAQRLQAVAGREPAKPYRVDMKLGLQYDDNVVLEPVDSDIVADEGDWLGVFFYSARYNMIDQNNIIFGAGYNHYQTWHDDLEEYDLTGSIVDVYVKYRFDRFSFDLTYSPNYYWLDATSYVMKHQLKPEVSWKVNDDLVAKLSYSYYRNKYFEDSDRNGHTHEGFLNLYYRLFGKTGYVYGGIGYEDVTASHPDQYFGQLKTKLGASFNLPLALVFNTTLKYYLKEYDHEDSVYGVEREDDKYNILVSLSRKLFYYWLRVVGEYSYTKNDSNISDYEYERNVTTLSVVVNF